MNADAAIAAVRAKAVRNEERFSFLQLVIQPSYAALDHSSDGHTEVDGQT